MYHIYAAGKVGTQESFTVDVKNSGNAESILRGLVHEGYEVTIREINDEKPHRANINANYASAAEYL